MAQANDTLGVNMRLFGMPYQFPESVDPRVPNVSNEIGLKFAENIVLEAPVLTLMPGKPIYLPGNSKNRKRNTTVAFLEAMMGNATDLEALRGDGDLDNLKIYDFQNDYGNYITYVNILCRTGATMLDIDEEIDGVNLLRYNWGNYKWSTSANPIENLYTGFFTEESKKSKRKKEILFDFDSSAGTDTDENPKSNIKSSEWSLQRFVQFYIDPDFGPSDDFSNATGSSMLKSAFEQGESAMKDLAFMANSGGIGDITEAGAQFTDQISSGVSQIIDGSGGSLGGALARIMNLGGDVVKGNNIIIPDIYQSSSYSKNYTVTVHLKTPYGSKFGYYMDIFVPMMHLLALSLPKMESANSYSSPFLVKGGVNGMFNVNLGIVTGITINRVTESLTVDGLPTEVDVSLNITDLYSDMTISPSTNPVQFLNNASLIEYLGTVCGLSLTSPNLETKLRMMGGTAVNTFADIPATVKNTVVDQIEGWMEKVLFLQ